MTYLKPVTPNQFPNSLNVTQFIQSVLAGVSALPGNLVRPKWQKEPPKQPDIDTTWMAFGIQSSTPNDNLYIGVKDDGSNITSRHEKLEIQCSLYGPNAIELEGLIRDGFSIQTNLENLRAARMGFTEIGPGLRVPDLINDRWVDRMEFTLVLQREVQRTYPILTFLSANGTVHAPTTSDDEYQYDFKTETP